MAPARRQGVGDDAPERPLGQRRDRASADRDASGEWLDVPATVLCAFCGDAECGGCENHLARSGIVSIVAWERPAVPALARLWSTARATTCEPESFFEHLPDGPLMPALRFAATCELLASSVVFASSTAIAALVAPRWLQEVVLDPGARTIALRVLLLGLPAFAALLVLAHVVHGLSIDLGATRSGGRSARTRALRFGLYSCGWDVMMGPVGVVGVASKEGSRAATSLVMSSLSGLPTRATKAFLRGAYRLENDRARAALQASYVGATMATLLVPLVVCVAVVGLLLS